jgi:hypothetical protein
MASESRHSYGGGIYCLGLDGGVPKYCDLLPRAAPITSQLTIRKVVNASPRALFLLRSGSWKAGEKKEIMRSSSQTTI